VSTQPLLPVVSTLLPPQYGTHSLQAFALVLHHILSIIFLKCTVSIRPSVHPSGSHKCIRFGLWSTLHTIKDFNYLLTYLLYTSSLMLVMNQDFKTHSCRGMSWYWDLANSVQADRAETTSVRPVSDLSVLDKRPESDQCDLDINIQCDMHRTTASVVAVVACI